MVSIIVNAAGLAFIGFIVWWFWLSRPVPRHLEDSPITIVVEDGVYTPAHIEVKRERPIVLRFLRKDPSPCAAKVIFSELGVSVDLPVGEDQEVRLKPLQAGEFEFTCEMHMYRGMLSVK